MARLRATLYPARPSRALPLLLFFPVVSLANPPIPHQPSPISHPPIPLTLSPIPHPPIPPCPMPHRAYILSRSWTYGLMAYLYEPGPVQSALSGAQPYIATSTGVYFIVPVMCRILMRIVSRHAVLC